MKAKRDAAGAGTPAAELENASRNVSQSQYTRDDLAGQVFDGGSWQAELNAHLARLPDQDLAATLRGDIATKMRAALKTGDAPPLDLLTADYILTADWPEPVWAIPELLPAGLANLAGRPKIGKSWMDLQIAHAVGAGGVVLGERVEQGRVLYLALEDPPRRLQGRMQKQCWRQGLPVDFMVLGQFEEHIGDLHNGGGERLARLMEYKCYRLVIIDTYSRAVMGDPNDHETVMRALIPVQEMAHAQNCSVLLTDHHRKPGPADLDAIADILGSTAKGAVCDTAWGLYKEQGKAGAKLVVTGRDVEERNLALTWDGELGCWQFEGDADELEMTERRQEILDALEVLGKAQLNAIVKMTGQDRSNTYKRLQDLANAGKAKRWSEGDKVFYALPSYEE